MENNLNLTEKGYCISKNYFMHNQQRLAHMLIAYKYK